MNEQPAKQTTQPRVAVLIPCRNEAVAAVVGAFRAALPDATIYVYLHVEHGSQINRRAMRIRVSSVTVIGHDGAFSVMRS
jgi:hypothetical protein